MRILPVALAIVVVAANLSTAAAQCASGGGLGFCPPGGGLIGGVLPQRPYPGIRDPFRNPGFPGGIRIIPGPFPTTPRSPGIPAAPTGSTPPTPTETGEEQIASNPNTNENDAIPTSNETARPVAATETEQLRGELDDLFGNAREAEEDLEVVIQDPRTREFLKFKEFKSRKAAEKSVDQITAQFWLITENYDGERQYKTGNRAAVADHLLNQGATVERVVAQIREINNESLVEVLPPIAARPDTENPPTPEPTETIPADSPLPEPSNLGALVGVWEAVAVSESGEPVKLVLKLDAGGTTTLTLPDGAGAVRTIETRSRLVDDQLLLPDGSSLGKVERIEADRLILNGDDGQVTLTRHESEK